jgi:hypothetical protein
MSLLMVTFFLLYRCANSNVVVMIFVMNFLAKCSVFTYISSFPHLHPDLLLLIPIATTTKAYIIMTCDSYEKV